MTERFWRYVEPTCAPREWDWASCWLWTGGLSKRGYGLIMERPGVVRFAHRIAFKMYHGRPAEPGMVVYQTCRNPACVNPEHLEEITNQESRTRGEGRIAAQARQTHCKRGHPLSGDNLKVCATTPHKRFCKACQHLRYLERKRQKEIE